MVEQAKRDRAGIAVPWGALMVDWETIVMDVQVTFGAVWHRCLADPWPWWRAMVLNLLRRPETLTYRTHILPRLPKNPKSQN